MTSDEVSPYDLYDASDVIKLCRDVERGIRMLPCEERMVIRWIDDYVWPRIYGRGKEVRMRLLNELCIILNNLGENPISHTACLMVDDYPIFECGLIDECMDGKRRISYNSRAFMMAWNNDVMRTIIVGGNA